MAEDFKVKSIPSKNFKEGFEEYADYVSKNHSPVFIQSENKENVVLISKQDYEVIDETAYFLASKENREKLIQTAEEIMEGKADYTTFNSLQDFKNSYGL